MRPRHQKAHEALPAPPYPQTCTQEERNVTVYHGADQLDHAQVMLQRHTVSSADGLCVACHVPGPCGQHEIAAKIFTLSLRLPRRVPGATRPELVNARRVGPGGPTRHRGPAYGLHRR
jgi:hypothetical protein